MKIDIYMSCPACFSQGQSTSRQYWRHGWPCGGILTLDDQAKVACKKCSSSGRLIDMTLTCEEQHEYKIASIEGYAGAISTSAHFVNDGGISWLQSVLRNL
jgi:hypothetical protein